ncbi:MAG TPA: SPFH domain-containing protein [Vicinamibacterales bacterium]|nr:SPFH domain-containing protein [Vicinamibacterales bacterium]
MIRERKLTTVSGWVMVPLLVIGMVLVGWLMGQAGIQSSWLMGQAGIQGYGELLVSYALVEGVLGFLLLGVFVVNPNEARVTTLFGRYSGSVKTDGFHWANPLLKKRHLSLRIRNFESTKIKVNDHEGNPIEIAAIVVWRVVETAEAMFEVENYEHYVKVQSEAAVRNLASQYPYDAYVEGQKSLRGNTSEVAEHLKEEVQARLAKAGLEVLETRISHLAYAPEIAAAMLQRQQAGAIIAARQRIVEGAVGMVEMALELLSRREIVTLDNERKASMVSNLLVVLCGDRNTQPVINTGTIYQ